MEFFRYFIARRTLYKYQRVVYLASVSLKFFFYSDPGSVVQIYLKKYQSVRVLTAPFNTNQKSKFFVFIQLPRVYPEYLVT